MATKKHLYFRILELLLLATSVVITAVPAMFCAAMLSDTYKFDLPEHPWRTAGITIAAAMAILGFFALVLRIGEIFTRECSKVIMIGLILGIIAYLFFMVPVVPDMWRNKILLLVYTIPAVSMIFSLRNIYLQRKGLIG